MSVYGRFNFVPCGFEIHRKANFSNHLGAFTSDNVCSQNFAMWLSVKNFDKTFRFSSGESFAARNIREFTDFKFEAFFFRSALR